VNLENVEISSRETNMSSCTSIDPFVTQYVDGELAAADRAVVDDHLRRCAPCYTRVAAEAAARDLVRSRQPGLTAERAPARLRAWCNGAARRAAEDMTADAPGNGLPRLVDRSWLGSRLFARVGIVPVAAAAMLVLVVGGVFLYQATHYSSRVLAAELTADHLKCFVANRLLGTRDRPAAVESSMMAAFGWTLHLPEQFDASGYELVGSRQCLYGEGRIAHLMYRDDRGRPVSIFMLPKRARAEELVEVMGHEAAIWSSGDRTFVLVTRGSPDEVQRMASFVKAALQ
jgi:anti-sigma factor RsiW